jgi:hypothetical protein
MLLDSQRRFRYFLGLFKMMNVQQRQTLKEYLPTHQITSHQVPPLTSKPPPVVRSRLSPSFEALLRSIHGRNELLLRFHRLTSHTLVTTKTARTPSNPPTATATKITLGGRDEFGDGGDGIDDLEVLVECVGICVEAWSDNVEAF